MPVPSEHSSSTTEKRPPLPIELDHVFGTTSNHLSNAVHVVSAPTTNSEHGNEAIAILYPAGNNAIIYNASTRAQTVLQGHCNPIASCSISTDRKWAVTSDTGPGSVLIVWDLTIKLPIKTIFGIHNDCGGEVCAFSHNSRYLATIGGGNDEQELHVWDWTTPESAPVFQMSIPTDDQQISLKFSPKSSSHLISSGQASVHFWHWDHPTSPLHQPDLDSELKDQIYTTSAYIGPQSIAIGCQSGDLILWNQKPTWMLEKVHHHLNRLSIIVIESLPNGIIATGGSDGILRFFDSSFRLVAHHEGMHAGPIMSISACTPNGFSPGIPSVVVSTSNAKVICVSQTKSVVETNLLIEGPGGTIQCISMHPLRPWVVLAMSNESIQLWNYENKTIDARVSLPKGEACTVLITAIRPLPDSSGNDQNKYTGLVITGSNKGAICLLGDDLLNLCAPIQVSSLAIMHIAVTKDCSMIACSDEKMTVAIVKRTACDKDTFQYHLMGRIQAHSKPMIGLWFQCVLDTTTSSEPSTKSPTQARLFSLSKDRHCVEYDLLCVNQHRDNNPLGTATSTITVHESKLLEQTYTPTAMTVSKNHLYVATDAYKLQTFNKHTLVCRDSVLVGVFAEYPIQYMCPVEWMGKQYMVFATQKKIMGLFTLPNSGNPFEAMGVLAHTDKMSGLCVSMDGKTAFSAGGDNQRILKVWRVNPEVLDQQAEHASTDPYTQLVNPTNDPSTQKHLEDLFYYTQIREKGESDPTVVHRLRQSIGAHMLPDLLRAFGHFPTETEIDRMLSIIQLKSLESGTDSTLSLTQVLQAFVQFRDASPLTIGQVQAAVSESKQKYSLGDLRSFLMTYGEAMSSNEVDGVAHLLDELVVREEDYN